MGDCHCCNIFFFLHLYSVSLLNLVTNSLNLEDTDLANLLNLVSPFDDSLMMNSATLLEYPPKVLKINQSYIKPSCSL